LDNIKRVFIAISVLCLFAGCTKKAMIGNCEEGDYESFLHFYPIQCAFDSLKGNGAFEIWRADMEYSGTFSIFYHNASDSWGMDFYGFFGMLVTSVRIKGDSFSLFSPFLDKPMEGHIRHFNAREYIGISLDAYSIQMLTTGRIPFDPLLTPSRCVKKNGLIEFSLETEDVKNTIAWSPLKKQVEQFTSGQKNGEGLLAVAFEDYKNASSRMLPHTITFTYRGREEAYLKLNYKYIKAE
jgi:hypothetical protein